MFLPMSCTSPSTVPMITVLESGSRSSTRMLGPSTDMATLVPPAMAIICGRNSLPFSKRRPTVPIWSWMASMIVLASMPAEMQSLTAASISERSYFIKAFFSASISWMSFI